MLLPVALVVLALGLGGCGGGDAGPAAHQALPDRPPAPDSSISSSPASLAKRLETTQRALNRAIDAWRGHGEPSHGSPPENVTLYALDQQRVHILLSERPRLATAALPRLPRGIAAHARATIRARRELARLATPQPLRRFRTGAPEPAGLLLHHYRTAQRRFDVSWTVLAAVNLVESAFGRMRNRSSAGAQGPMQFIPATWAAYGLGGDVRDPRDAILGAANYLHANGAPRDYRGALYHYNPSPLYVDAVLAYADRIRRDTRSFFSYYAWQVFVRTPRAIRRITGPGL
jgi:soluble lytic murein transglycosylase-like protein